MSTTQAKQSRTIIGPLTTTFNPPPECTYAVAACSDCNFAWSAQTCVTSGAQDNPSCWPSSSDGLPQPPNTLDGWGFYSPGTLCPSGFVSACSATAGGEMGWRVQFEMEAGETAVGCCPSGFGCDGSGGRQTCVMKPTSTAIPTVQCSDGTSANFGQMSVPNTKYPDGITLYAQLIQINWKSADRPATTTARTTSTPPTAPANNNKDGGSSGIGTGAIVGIVVGVVALLLIVGGILFWRRRRATRRMGVVGSKRPKELDGSGRVVHEMPTQEMRPAELSAGRG